MIQTLPTDVLREIFRRCLPPYKYQESIHFEVDKPPYTLAKVCRHWRLVCLSTALLWVDLPMFTDETPHISEFSGHWKTKLALSSPCDLRFFVNHYSGLPEAGFANAFGRIHPALTFPRVRMLDLCADVTILKAISQHVDLFKRLQILKINLIDHYFTHLPQLDFQSKVTSLTLQSRNKRVEFSRSLLKCVETLFPSLTKFDGDNLPASSLPEILAVAPLLTELTIRNIQAASASDPVSSPLIHTRLKILHLICKSPKLGNPGVPLPIDLSRICLSELEDLVVQYRLPTLSSTFLSFLQHTQGSLRNLYIGGVLESSYDQKAMYDLCPLLETLTMTHANDESLKHLALTGNSPMCPGLRHLTLPFFRLNSELEVGLQTFWLSQLTSYRFWRPNDPIESVPLESLTVVLTKASNFLHFQSLQDLSQNLSYFVSSRSIPYSRRLRSCILSCLTPRSLLLRNGPSWHDSNKLSSRTFIRYVFSMYVVSHLQITTTDIIIRT